MRVVFDEDAWDDYLYWQRAEPKIVQRINSLIENIQRTPYQGIGKPEALRHALSGYWSRRITEEHRIVYRIKDDELQIAQLRYHYG
jgi:toxin YoeB